MHHSQTDFEKAITRAITKVGFMETLAMLEKIYEPQRKLAETLNQSVYFPCTVVLGRKNAAKERKVKKRKTRQQNNWGVVTFYADSLGTYISTRKNLKHKGYPLLLSMVDPDDWEVPAETSWRIKFRFYKSFDEYMTLKQKVNDQEWINASNHINLTMPAKAHGQQRLF